MITETEIKLRGVRALSDALGPVGAERFIGLILREPFDYTVWRKDLFKDKTIEEISEEAMLLRNRKKQN